MVYKLVTKTQSAIHLIFAVGANDKFKVELQRASSILDADATILIEI